MKDVAKTGLHKGKNTTRSSRPVIVDFSKEKQKRDRMNAAEAVAKRAQKLGW